MRRPLIAGNWKMHGSRNSVAALLDGIQSGMSGVRKAEAAVCPPFVYLAQVQTQLHRFGCHSIISEPVG